jgi:hypothetical protein
VVPEADPELTTVGVALALVVVDDTSTVSVLPLLLVLLVLLSTSALVDALSPSLIQYVSFLYSMSGHLTSGFRRLSSSTVIFHCFAKDSHVSPGFEAVPKPLQSEAKEGARRERVARRRVERMVVVGWRVGGGVVVVMRWRGEVERMKDAGGRADIRSHA